jgi:hypothetical protein
MVVRETPEPQTVVEAVEAAVLGLDHLLLVGAQAALEWSSSKSQTPRLLHLLVA